MAYKPKEMQDAKLNADGFGIGWLNRNSFFTYKNSYPVWNDLNIKSISENISSKLILGNVRSATILENNGLQNTHPFFYNNLLFSHNGFIENFTDINKQKIIEKIDTKYLKFLKGNTDSEYIFCLFMQNLKQKKQIPLAIEETFLILESIYKKILLNLLIGHINSEGKTTLFATRIGYNSVAPSLYYKKDEGNDGYLISSEKMDNTKWVKVKNNSILSVKSNSIKEEKIK